MLIFGASGKLCQILQILGNIELHTPNQLKIEKLEETVANLAIGNIKYSTYRCYLIIFSGDMFDEHSSRTKTRLTEGYISRQTSACLCISTE
jgi:hypothetical protein